MGVRRRLWNPMFVMALSVHRDTVVTLLYIQHFHLGRKTNVQISYQPRKQCITCELQDSQKKKKKQNPGPQRNTTTHS